MTKRQSIEHFERTLRDICSKNIPFGGKFVVFGGDFRQVLPVIPKSTLREAINASLVMSPLWPTLEKFKLTINMRAINDPCFSDFVLNVGEGCPPYENGKDITLPRTIVINSSQHLSLLHRLIEAIYPNVDDINFNSLITTRKAILTPKNDDTKAINSILVSRQRGEAFEYKSFDEAIDITTEQYPIELMNTLNPGRLPPHHLVLKKNSPIILLRNLDPTFGLCNGTRLICKAFSRNIIDAKIVVGHHKGERVFIPRIPLQPSPADKFPFNFKRKQFSIKLSFVMTINKAHGQILDKLGIYLPQPVFFTWSAICCPLSSKKKF
ncbi:uncharacterized protein LOC141639372 [Silene latifolia]|uniref:uncharacterized protein LOC141639372 n=1 Tax=Silene latifolia TaxID=37657 RepID=UPI003D778445